MATGTSAGIRERNLRAVLDTLRERRPVSRADLALRTGLSKPTVSAALRAFERRGLVREYGRTTGRRGRSASLYDLVPESVLVVGIDIGARHVRAVVGDLDGRPVEEFSLDLADPRAADVLSVVAEIGTRIRPLADRTELAVVGSPGVVDPGTGRIGAAPNIADWEGGAVEAARRGDPLGRAVAGRAAEEIAVCVAALTAVVDLELILLGGGIGASDDLLLPDVRAAAALLLPSPPRIERASLGDRAVGTGAIAIALEEARQSVIRRLVEADAPVASA